MTILTRVALPLAAAGLFACSSKAGPAPAGPAPVATAEPAGKQDQPSPGGIGAPNIPWKDKTRAQRQDYMGIYVLPKMEELFANWRPDDYGEQGSFRCQTCHGDGFDKPPVDFEMPRVAFPLKADDPIAGAMKYDPEATRFMVEQVLPTMAELLGEEPYNPDTGQGFSCFRCHPAKGSATP